MRCDAMRGGEEQGYLLPIAIPTPTKKPALLPEESDFPLVIDVGVDITDVWTRDIEARTL